MWYIQRKGRAEGPLPEANIVHAIQKGELGPYDLVFRDGDSRWQPLSEIPQFHSYFEKKTKSQKNLDDLWVALVKVPGQKTRRQKGPFTTEQLKKLLKNGEVQLTDYVWKDGMKEWYRIHSLEIFHRAGDPRTFPGEATLTATVPIVPSRGDELFKNVKIQEHPTPPPPDPVPLEATLVDFEAKKEAKKKPTSRRAVRKVENVKEETAVTQVRRLSWLDRMREFPWPRRSIGRFLMAGGVALVILLVLYGVTYYDWRNLMAQKPPAKPEPSKVARPVPTPRPDVVAEPTKPQVASNAAPTPSPTPEPVVAPTYLRLKVAQGFIDMQTNASKHFTVQLWITGEAGRVIGHRSYFKEVKVMGLAERKIAIESLNLPAGYYQVEAKVGDFQSQTAFSWKVADKGFNQNYAEHRKNIVHFATRERYYLFKTAEYLEGKAIEFGEKARQAKDLRGYYKEWSRSLAKVPGSYLRSITRRNRGDYVYASDWFKLRDLQKSLGDAAKAYLEAKDKNAPEATFALRQVSGELNRQKEAALRASLWR